MIWKNVAVGILFSIIFLIPFARKWCIRMRIAIPSVIIIGLLSGLMTSATLLVTPDKGWIWNCTFLILYIFVLSIAGLLLSFYRDPERTPPSEDGIILSPADGEVIYIKKINENELLHSNKKDKVLPISEELRKQCFPEAAYIIGIMMNFLNVHVNRAPIGGNVRFAQHIRGKFLSLRIKEAYFENERVITIFDNGLFKIGVIQIASRLVRRIVPFIKQGDQVKIGQKIGVIKFGSQVDLILPVSQNLKIMINKGDEVRSGLTIIARF